MNAEDVKYMTNAALLKQRESYAVKIAGAARVARYDKSYRPAVEQARSEAQMIEDEIKRRGIDDFLQQVPLL